MSRSKSAQTAQATVTSILKRDSEKFLQLADDLHSFYLYESQNLTRFLSAYPKVHPIMGDICINRPHVFRNKLIIALKNELNNTHTIAEVFRIVLCLEYIGVDSDSIFNDNKKINAKISCVKSLIKLYHYTWYIHEADFFKIHKALEMLD